MRLPLSDKTVVVTRATEQSRSLRDYLVAAGARVVEMPLLTFVPVGGDDLKRLDRALADLQGGEYDGVLFTSANAVAFLHARAQELGVAEAIGHTPLFAVGPATARALTAREYLPAFVARQATGGDLAAAVASAWGDEIKTKRFLFPRARSGREEILAALAELGARVDLCAVYETRAVREVPPLPDGRIDWVTFMSPSAVRAFAELFGAPPGCVACVGPTTAEAALELGIMVHAIAHEHTAAGLADAVVEACQAANEDCER